MIQRQKSTKTDKKTHSLPVTEVNGFNPKSSSFTNATYDKLIQGPEC